MNFLSFQHIFIVAIPFFFIHNFFILLNTQKWPIFCFLNEIYWKNFASASLGQQSAVLLFPIFLKILSKIIYFFLRNPFFSVFWYWYCIVATFINFTQYSYPGYYSILPWLKKILAMGLSKFNTRMLFGNIILFFKTWKKVPMSYSANDKESKKYPLFMRFL